jgi:hypothetical protein
VFETLCAVACWGIIAQSDAQSIARPEGQRVKLTVGQLFVPKGFAATDGRVHLVIHLHGATDAAENNMVRSGVDGVIVTVVLRGLSSVYAEQFAKPNTFPSMLDEAARELRRLGVCEQPAFDRVTMTSFSAGFGGVRELLKQEGAYQRIDSLVMADSIYAGFTGDPAERRVDPKLMAGFLRFARDAAEGKKRMVISYSQLRPETYASTDETARFVEQELAVAREPAQEVWADGWTLQSRAVRRGFRSYGFAGTTGADHMKHLHNLWRLIQRSGME